jgi:hypothetical protein
MQLLRLEQLHFGGAGRWFDTNRFSRGSRSSDKTPVFGFLLRIPFEGSESAVTSEKHPIQMIWFKPRNPRSRFSLVSLCGQ